MRFDFDYNVRFVLTIMVENDIRVDRLRETAVLIHINA